MAGGRMVIPIGPEDGVQVLTQVDRRHDGSVVQTKIMDVSYQAIMDAQTQLFGTEKSTTWFCVKIYVMYL